MLDDLFAHGLVWIRRRRHQGQQGVNARIIKLRQHASSVVISVFCVSQACGDATSDTEVFFNDVDLGWWHVGFLDEMHGGG